MVSLFLLKISAYIFIKCYNDIRLEMLGLEYCLYLDDSGGLHPNNDCDYFVYGGFLVPKDNVMLLSNRIRGIEQNIFKTQKEIKASTMSYKLQKKIINGTFNYCYPVFVVVKISSLLKVDFTNPKKVTRYKNFMIRVLVEKIAKNNMLTNCTKLNIFLDEQSIAVSAKDSLEDYLYNMFVYETYSTNYINPYIPTINIDFHVEYKDSKHNKLIQLADIYANSKYRRFKYKEVGSSKKLEEKCICIKLPHNATYKSF